MKNTTQKIIISLCIFIITISQFSISLGATVAKDLKDIPKGTSYVPTSLNWIKCVRSVASTIYSSKFKYSTSGVKTTLSAAKKNNKKSDCAHLISWALQEFGAIKDGNTLYSKSSDDTVLHYSSSNTKKQLSQNATIIKVNVPASNEKKLKSVLRVGDICCYNNHMNVVAGVDADGHILFYDGGKYATTNTNSAGGTFKEIIKKPRKRLDENFKSKTLLRIIRLKSQTTPKEKY